jgi:hypothetical protein
MGQRFIHVRKDGIHIVGEFDQVTMHMDLIPLTDAPHGTPATRFSDATGQGTIEQLAAHLSGHQVFIDEYSDLVGMALHAGKGSVSSFVLLHERTDSASVLREEIEKEADHIARDFLPRVDTSSPVLTYLDGANFARIRVEDGRIQKESYMLSIDESALEAVQYRNGVVSRFDISEGEFTRMRDDSQIIPHRSFDHLIENALTQSKNPDLSGNPQESLSIQTHLDNVEIITNPAHPLHDHNAVFALAVKHSYPEVMMDFAHLRDDRDKAQDLAWVIARETVAEKAAMPLVAREYEQTIKVRLDDIARVRVESESLDISR